MIRIIVIGRCLIFPSTDLIVRVSLALMGIAMILSDKISRTKKLPPTIVVILTVGLMVLWRTCDFGSPPSGHSRHQSEHGTVPDVGGERRNATEARTREPEGKGKDKSSKLNEPVKLDSAPLPSRDVQAFGENGQLTTQAIENLNLTSDEVASLTQLLSTVKEQAAADFVSRTKLTENVSAGNGGFRHTYFVNARQDRGMEFSTALAMGSETLIGPARSQRIKSNISTLDFLAGAGKYDLNIVVSSDGGEKVVKYERIDPKRGGVVEVQECSYNFFLRTFGNVFAY